MVLQISPALVLNSPIDNSGFSDLIFALFSCIHIKNDDRARFGCPTLRFTDFLLFFDDFLLPDFLLAFVPFLPLVLFLAVRAVVDFLRKKPH